MLKLNSKPNQSHCNMYYHARPHTQVRSAKRGRAVVHTEARTFSALVVVAAISGQVVREPNSWAVKHRSKNRSRKRGHFGRNLPRARPDASQMRLRVRSSSQHVGVQELVALMLVRRAHADRGRRKHAIACCCKKQERRDVVKEAPRHQIHRPQEATAARTSGRCSTIWRSAPQHYRRQRAWPRLA